MSFVQFKSMFTKDDYKEMLPIKKQLKTKTSQDPYRLGFHIMPPTGWLNDPNGLCQFKGRNHIYFQYTPFTPTWGMKSWGHYTTSDWTTYTEEEPFLFADCEYDKDGVYSGSAWVSDDEIHYFYTGNVKYTDGKYNYITDGREQNTITLTSKDGFTYQDKTLVFANKDYPVEMSCHVRDPMIFQKHDAYYMVLGARSNTDVGCVLLYKSSDLIEWSYHMTISADKPFGYMWECPNLIELQGKTYLVCCPQGVPQEGYQYQNVYQFGYFELRLDLDKKEYELSSFQELDKGFDIYAPQIFQDEQGRHILLAWMGIPDATYDNQKSIEQGWQHALTLPRQLCVEDGILCQKPLVEFQSLRKHMSVYEAKDTFLCNAPTMYEVQVSFKTCNEFEIQLRDGVVLTYHKQVLSLLFDACGCGRDSRKSMIPMIKQLQIFMDTSSVEVFINGGQEVFTSRYYTQKNSGIHMQGDFEANITLYELNACTINELKE